VVIYMVFILLDWGYDWYNLG